MILPSSNEKLGPWLKANVIDPCNESVENRISAAREIKQWVETGSDNANPSIFNKLVEHCDKLASNIFSPADVRFLIEFENDYPEDIIERGRTAASYLTREFARRDLDLKFGIANEVAVPHASAILKAKWGHDGPEAELLMHWQLGVYREDVEELDKQEAIVETTYITEQELWRRISHRTDARDLYNRARGYAKRNVDNDFQLPNGLQNILLGGSSPYIQNQGATPQIGGAVSTGGGMSGMARLHPNIAGSLIRSHECYVVNDVTGDYTTCQVIAPDILIHPRSLRTNLFVPMDHPYTLIQPNPQPGYIWGRSEILDLVLLQAFIRDRLYDIKGLMNLQYERRYAFFGFDGMNDELYEQFKDVGWIANSGPMGKIEDLTPPLPDHAFEELDHVIRFFDVVAGYDNVLSGKGEPGIRSAGHFQGALRAASPRLRDRAVRVERQVASFAEKILWLMAAKDGRAHWTKENDPARKTDFILSALPDDSRVVVAGHSSSPVFEQDFANLAAFLKRDGDIDGEDVLDLLPVPNRDNLKHKLRKREKAKQEFLQSLSPEDRVELMKGGGGGGGRKAGGSKVPAMR